MKKIFLDTNFLMSIMQFKIDIFSEIDRIIDETYTILVLDKTIQELEEIIKTQKTKEKKAAQFALKAVRIKNISVYETKENKDVDDILAGLSRDNNVIIATLDKDLKKRLEGKMMVIRQKKFVELI